MTALLWVLVAALVVWLAVKRKTFRWIVLGVLAAIGVGIFGFIQYQNVQEERRKHLIQQADLKFSDVSLWTSKSDREQWLMKGVVENASRYTLSSLDFRLKVYDCAENTSDLDQCKIIGDDSGFVLLTVPPGQVRSFQADFRFSNMGPAKGKVIGRHELGAGQ